jgi:hypothetical protein
LVVKKCTDILDFIHTRMEILCLNGCQYRIGILINLRKRILKSETTLKTNSLAGSKSE